jgi:hypothetical protein
MELQRSNSDAIEKSFHDSLKDGDSSFLLDTAELGLDDVSRLRSALLNPDLHCGQPTSSMYFGIICFRGYSVWQ